jgi:invasion protein IalB
MSKKVIARLAGLALLAGAAPVAAQSSSSTPPAPNSKAKDPNRVICERVEEVGSRLASKRVCLTAQQWEEQRRLDRDTLEENQRKVPGPSSG